MSPERSSEENNVVLACHPCHPPTDQGKQVTDGGVTPLSPLSPVLCSPRKSAMRMANRTGRVGKGAFRYPRNRKAGPCRGCGSWLPRGQGCIEIHGIHSWLYC